MPQTLRWWSGHPTYRGCVLTAAAPDSLLICCPLLHVILSLPNLQSNPSAALSIKAQKPPQKIFKRKTTHFQWLYKHGRSPIVKLSVMAPAIPDSPKPTANQKNWQRGEAQETHSKLKHTICLIFFHTIIQKASPTLPRGELTTSRQLTIICHSRPPCHKFYLI